MIEALLNPILPVFALFGVGFFAGHRRSFDLAEARAINRFVIQIGVPALIFYLIVTSDIANFDLGMLSLYLVAGLVIYVLGTLIARLVFNKPWPEAVLLGMAAAFCNHVFYVLPIALELYGPGANLPVISIITMDAVTLFGLTVVLMEFMSGEKRAPIVVFSMLFKNPMLIAIFLGLACNLLAVPFHDGVITFLKFTGAAAAPASLFALGIILANSSPFRLDTPAITVSALKLFAYPLLFFVMASSVGISSSPDWKPALLVAAGPCGAMPFVIAVQYKVPSGSIAKAIVYSTAVSLFTLAWLA